MKTRAPTPKAAVPKPADPVAVPTAELRPPTINLLSLPIHAARRGVATANQRLPHLERVQSAFGRHDISDVRTTVGNAPVSLDANAYTVGDRVAFARDPDVHLAAHEAAHVVQQRAGVTPTAEHEDHAERVAEAVTRGHSAESLLDRVAPTAAPVSVVQFDREEDTATDSILIAILERGVAKGDSEAANARVRDLTAELLALPAGKALVLAMRLNTPKRGDKLAQLFQYRLSSGTGHKLIVLLAARWGMQVGLGIPAPQMATKTSAAASTPLAPATPAPTPALPEEPHPRWAAVAAAKAREFKEGLIIEPGIPTYLEIDRLVDRLEGDDLRADAELIDLIHIDKRFSTMKDLTGAPLRMLVAVRLETFLQRYADFVDAIPALKRARKYIDAHSHEFVALDFAEAVQEFGDAAAKEKHEDDPAMIIDGKVVASVRNVHNAPRDIALNFVIQPALAAAKLIPALKALGGYVVGVPLGALDAIQDLVEAGLANLSAALTFMKSLFTGEFLKEIYKLCVKIYDFISNLPEMATALEAWFEKEWNDAGPFGKGELVGKIVGYVAMTIAIGVLTEGKSLEYSGGRLKNLAMKVLKITGKVANPFTYVKPFMKPLAAAAKAVPGVERALASTARITKKLGEVTAPARRLAGKATRAPGNFVRKLVRAAAKDVDNVAEVAEAGAPGWEGKFWRERDAARAGHAMPSMAVIEAAPTVAHGVTPMIAREAHDLTPVMVDGEIWLRMCSKKCGPLLGKLEATDGALAKAGASDDIRAKVRDLADRTKALQDDWPNLDEAAAEKRLEELSSELEALGKSDPNVGKAIAEGELGQRPQLAVDQPAKVDDILAAGKVKSAAELEAELGTGAKAPVAEPPVTTPKVDDALEANAKLAREAAARASETGGKGTYKGPADVRKAIEALPDEEAERLLYRVVRRDAKGRAYGTPKHPDPPSIEEFNPRIEEIRAGDVGQKVAEVKHGINPKQGDSVGQLSNEELIRFRIEDPMSATQSPSGDLSLTGGHHRVTEIARRVAAGQLPSETPVPFLVHD